MPGGSTPPLRERLHFSLRRQNRRFTRKTRGYSKTLHQRFNVFVLRVVARNFTKQHTSLKGVTPAMEAGHCPDPIRPDRDGVRKSIP